MLNYAEEILLLALDDETGAIRDLPLFALENALVGAVMMELALLGRVDNDQVRFNVISKEPVGDPLLDDALGRLAQVGSETTIAEALEHLSCCLQPLRVRVLNALVRKGVLRMEDRKILWVFAVRRYPIVNGRETKEIKARLRELVLSDEIPDPRDVVLVSLVDACALWTEIFTKEELDGHEERIANLACMDLIGQELARTLRRIGAVLFSPQPF